MATEGLMDARGLAAGRGEAAHEADIESGVESVRVVLLVAVKVSLHQTCTCHHSRCLLHAKKCHTHLLMCLHSVEGVLERLVGLVRPVRS